MTSQPSFARSRSLTTCGLALPAIAFIVWPTKKPNSASLPALYSRDLVGVGGEDLVDRRVDRAGVAGLLEAALLDDRGRRPRRSRA